jgi:hypothetical protein
MLGLFGLLRHLFAALQKTLTFREKLARFASNAYPKPHHNATLWVNVVPIPFRPVRRLRSVGCRLRSVIPFSMWGFVGGFLSRRAGKRPKKPPLHLHIRSNLPCKAPKNTPCYPIFRTAVLHPSSLIPHNLNQTTKRPSDYPYPSSLSQPCYNRRNPSVRELNRVSEQP